MPAVLPSFGGDTSDDGSLVSRLRETVLTNADGDPVELGTLLGDDDRDATIVVFLRHLA